ncbi:hypothetical protein [Chryseobacterium jejuense]|uniref:Uncharacterized protein n=1 Tax=Chryseobacterium jejuense TaxID=445960 RepID=A0A2X2VJ25_CHRJE|nr:hypothetical protein [Chryseobacterium jejuense]SDJ21495.1 hypothetical protein SAMN05421542_3046 [Chryseobacterium jejuense]SQB28578.1 Uncharacterised protein [Chryseobacterium jejuense]
MPQNIPSGSLPTAPDSKGLNVRPDLLPESFFFLEKGKQFSQSSAGKFGANGTVFRTTSKISDYTGKVYTICQGQVFLQPCGTDSTKVNAILKPFSQPIKGLAIKYIVYRGLNRLDFFDNNLIINNGTGVTGFVDVIRKEFTGLYNMLGITVPPFTAQYIGYPAGTNQSAEDLIDDYFLKISKVQTTGTTTTEVDSKKAFELPMIPRGTHLGNVSGELGIDIVLNEGDYTVANDPNPFKLNLAFARKPDHVLDQAVGSNAFQKKLIRETATQFLDIAAFYGLHTQGKGKIHMSDNSVLQTPDAIYNQIQSFLTARTTYLYIQGSRQRSYNFYGNHSVNPDNSNNIKIGTTINNLSEKVFEQDWPLQILDNVSSLAIKLTTDSKEGSALYVKQGNLNSVTNHEDYFIREKNLLQENVSDEEFTKPIVFDISKTSNGINIASFIQLVYEGKVIPLLTEITPSTPNTTPEKEIWNLKDIDDIFGLINAKPRIQSKSSNEVHYVIDQNLLLIDFDNELKGKDIATVTTKRVEDLVSKDDSTTLMRVTYETLLNNIRQNVSGFFQGRTAYQDNSNSGTITYSDKINNFYRPESPYYLNKVIYTDSEGNIMNGLSLQVEEGTLPSKKLLGITDFENQKLVDIIENKQLNNPKFYFKNELSDENTFYTSVEKIQYKKYNLSVIGETQEGKLTVVSPDQKIYVTTTDNLVFSTDEYAKWMPLVVLASDSNVYEKIKS